MRMWKVDPKVLCRQHLLGEHCEMHMFVGCINKRGIKSLKGYIETGLVDISYLIQRHEELSFEMQRRGYNHKSLIPKPNTDGYFGNVGCVNVDNSLKELAQRCELCKKLQEENKNDK